MDFQIWLTFVEASSVSLAPWVKGLTCDEL